MRIATSNGMTTTPLRDKIVALPPMTPVPGPEALTLMATAIISFIYFAGKKRRTQR